jgi:hypothetical protein
VTLPGKKFADRILPLPAFFPLSLFFVAKKSNPRLRAVAIGFGRRRPVGKKNPPTLKASVDGEGQPIPCLAGRQGKDQLFRSNTPLRIGDRTSI